MMYGIIPFKNRRKEGPFETSNFLTFNDALEKFFNEPLFPAFSHGNMMKTDVRETKKGYVLEVEMPGINKENIKLNVENGILTVSVEHNEEVNEESKNYIRRERKTGSYSRCFNVEGVEPKDIKAKYDKGLLTLEIPKSDKPVDNSYSVDIQ